MPNPLVVVDLTAGTAHIAGATVAVRGQPGGGLIFDGLLIRPLTFGERCRLLEDDVTASGRSLGATVLARACAPISASESMDDNIAQILAMHLAGARPERRALAFEAQLSSLIAAGWRPHDVFDTDADLVDLLTADALGTPAEDGWTSILLITNNPAADSLTEVLLTLEQSLLDRMVITDLDDAADCSYPYPMAPTEFHSPARSFVHVEPRTGNGPPTVNRPEMPSDGGRRSIRALPVRTASSGETAGHAGADRTDSIGQPVGTQTVANHLDTAVALPSDAPRPIRAAWPGHRAANARPDASSTSALSARAPQLPSVVAMPFPKPVVSDVGTNAASQGRRPTNRATPPAGAASMVVRDDAVATRTAPLATPSPAGLDAFELADQLAALLDDESDLRGLRR